MSARILSLETAEDPFAGEARQLLMPCTAAGPAAGGSIPLAVVLAAGMCLAWAAGFWAVFAAQAGVVLVAAAWVTAEKQIHPTGEWIAVALISSWGILQIAGGQTVSSWLTTRSSLTWISAGLSFVVASSVLGRRENRKLFLSIILWSSTLLASIALLRMYLDPGRIFWIFPAPEGSVGTFLYKNQFAAMLEIAAPIALYRALFSHQARYPGFAAFAILFAAGVASVSRAGVVLLAAELVLVLLFAFRWRGLALAGLILALGTAIGGPQALWSHFQEKDPYGVRRDLLQSTLQMAADRPWFGFGMGTFPLAYPAYQRFDLGVFVNAAHSDWAEWSAEGGFPFAALIAALLLMTVKRAVRSVWGIGVLAVALHSLVDYPAREPTIVFLWFAILGALTAAAESKAPVADWAGRPAQRLRNCVPAAQLPMRDPFATG